MNPFGFAQVRRAAPSIAVLVALLLAPAAIAIEKYENALWNSRLILPSFTEEESLHTPRQATGLFLPPTISTNRTLSTDDSPVILTRTTTIPAGVTLTIDSGVEIFSHEYASLIVDGALIVNGSPANPVTFTTNELHPSNQVWAGLVFNPTGQGTIQHAHIKYGSPAITCMPDSAVVIQQTIIELGAVGLFTQSPNCSVSQSTIKHVDIGVVSFQKETALLDTIISARDMATKYIASTALPVRHQNNAGSDGQP